MSVSKALFKMLVSSMNIELYNVQIFDKEISYYFNILSKI